MLSLSKSCQRLIAGHHTIKLTAKIEEDTASISGMPVIKKGVALNFLSAMCITLNLNDRLIECS
jgi:hypothetical protein